MYYPHIVQYGVYYFLYFTNESPLFNYQCTVVIASGYMFFVAKSLL